MSGDATPQIELKNYLDKITRKSDSKGSRGDMSGDQASESIQQSEPHGIMEHQKDGYSNPDEVSSENLIEDSSKLHEDTYFKKFEAEKISSIITSIMAASEQESDGMDIKTFRQVMFKTLNLSRYFMIDRVFSIFDTDSDGKISPAEYISGLSTMLRGSLNDQIDFAFKIYDQAGKGFLTQEDVSICLNESSRPTVDEQAGNNNKFPRTNASAEVNDDLCQLIFPKLDADGDGQVTYDEFRAVCLKDPTLVESLGPCLPKNCSCPLAAQKDGNKNGSSSLDYLMKVSSMTKICKPFKTAVNRDLTPIDMQNK